MTTLNAANITIIGDSMALGLAVDASQTPPVVYENFNWGENISGSTVTNKGISGASIEYILSQAEQETSQLIIIWAGFNNLKIPEQQVLDIVKSYENLYRYYAACSGCEVYCIGVLPVNHNLAYPWWPIVTTFDNSRVMLFNSYLEALYGNRFIDIPGFAIEANGDCKPEYTADGVHPSVALYEYVLDQLHNLTFEGDEMQIVDWFDYFSQSIKTGWAGDVAGKIMVSKHGKVVFVMFYLNGTSNANNASFTLPYTSGPGSLLFFPYNVAIDNSVYSVSGPHGRLYLNSNVVELCHNSIGNAWTTYGNKQAYGQFFYAAAS